MKTTLDERKASILRAVVTEYVETGQPVGSGRVVDAPGVRVSGATVRHEMACLEEEGYLAQPHTSAGRIPTDLAYRFFVDQLSMPLSLEPARRQEVRDFFRRAHGELEEMLEATSGLLSRLTDCAAVVMAPSPEGAIVRSAQVVSIGATVAMAVLVLSNGAVEKAVIDLGAGVPEAGLAAASAHLAAHLVGQRFSAARAKAVPITGDDSVDRVVAAVLEAIGDSVRTELEQVYMRGTSRVAEAFDAVETVRAVLSTLETHYVVVSLIRDLLDRDQSVAIGTEHGVPPLAECAVVVARYQMEGGQPGAVGVLGPTRMDYAHAMAAVALVGERLSRRLSDG